MTIQLGVAPIAWSNDDLPELGGDTPLEVCLREAREAGYTGIEAGGKFPRDPAVLGPLLREHGLQLASGWFSGALLNGTVAEENAASPSSFTCSRRSARRSWSTRIPRAPCRTARTCR